MESRPSAPQGFSGTISLQLSDLVQMVCFCGSDMIIRVHGSSGSGTIHIKGGNLRHAQTGGLQGEKAFFEMLAWEDGRFETLPCHDLEIISIEKPWEHLLLEATRLRDEGGAARGDGFGPDRPGGRGETGTGPATEGAGLDEMDDLAAELDRTFQEMGLFELSHEADTTYEAFQAVEAGAEDAADLTDVGHGMHGPRGGCGDSDPDGALEAVPGGAIVVPGASRPLRVVRTTTRSGSSRGDACARAQTVSVITAGLMPQRANRTERSMRSQPLSSRKRPARQCEGQPRTRAAAVGGAPVPSGPRPVRPTLPVRSRAAGRATAPTGLRATRPGRHRSACASLPAARVRSSPPWVRPAGRSA